MSTKNALQNMQNNVEKRKSINLVSITSRKIGFLDALTWIFVVIGYAIFYAGYGSNESDWSGPMLIYKLGAIPCLSIFLALLTRNYKMWKPILANVWQIAVSNVSYNEKQELIKKNLEKIMERWYSYWIQFQKIVISSDSLDKKMTRVKLLFKEIYTGEINIFQMIWIICYLIYTLIVGSNYWQIPVPIDFIINIAFFTVLLYSKGDVAGIKDLLFRIFLCLAPAKTEKDLETNMKRLIEELKDNNEVYNYIALESEQTQAKAPALQSSIKVAPKGELFTPEQVQKSNLKDLSQSLGEAKTKVNGELKTMDSVKDI